VKKVLGLLLLLVFFSNCSSLGLGKKEPPALVMEEVNKTTNKKCDYDGYVKLTPIKEFEVIPSPTYEPISVLYKGDNFNNKGPCYGETIVFKEMKEKGPVTFYFHFLERSSLKEDYYQKLLLVGSTKIKKGKEDGSFLFKAVQDGQVQDPKPYVKWINISIEGFHRSVENGLFMARDK
jgi:hypothetical protein